MQQFFPNPLVHRIVSVSFFYLCTIINTLKYLSTMKKRLLTIGCVVALVAGCCNSSNQPADGKTCDYVAKKESLEIIMNIPIKIKPEFVAAYKVAFEKCQAGTLQEEACLDYVIFQSDRKSTRLNSSH